MIPVIAFHDGELAGDDYVGEGHKCFMVDRETSYAELIDLGQ